jgi:hypothetical protein
MAKHHGRLELTWTNKEKTLLSTGDGKYDYTFVDTSDRRVAEVRLLHQVDRIESETPSARPVDLPTPTSDNLLITGDAMHVLDALGKDEELGVDNFVAEVIWEKADSPNNSSRYLSKDQDFVLVYASNKSSWSPHRLPRTAASDAIYTNPDWRLGAVVGHKEFTGRHRIALSPGLRRGLLVDLQTHPPGWRQQRGCKRVPGKQARKDRGSARRGMRRLLR